MPDLHPVKSPKAIPPVNFRRHFEEEHFVLGFENGTAQEITTPSFNHITTVHPLYGIDHVSGTKFSIYNPFDHDAQPVRFSKWMNTKVLEVNELHLTAERILREMVNNEGAHIGNSLPTFLIPEPLKY